MYAADLDHPDSTLAQKLRSLYELRATKDLTLGLGQNS